MIQSTDVSFFVISVADQTGWIAVSSMLGAFKLLYGPAVFLHLNLAYYLPSIPVLLFQAQFDHRLNARFGLPSCTIARMVFGLGGSAVILALLPAVMWRAWSLLACTTLLGITTGIAFSSSYQIVSHFSPRSSVALTTGFVGGGPLVLLLQFTADIGPRAKTWQAALLFTVSSMMSVVGLITALHLVRHHWRHLEVCGGGGTREPLLPWWQKSRSQTAASSKDNTPPGSPAHSRTASLSIGYSMSQELSPEASGSWAEDGQLLDPPGRHPKGAGLAASWMATWPAAAALFLSIGSSMIVAPFFTYVPSSGWAGDLLPQALFAARTLSDIAGRVLPFMPCIRTRAGLLAAGLARAAATPVFFWYIAWAASHHMLNDVVVIAAIAMFWAASGHINACAYVMAAHWAPPGHGDQAGGLMALVFQVACLLALLLAAAVQQLRFQ